MLCKICDPAINPEWKACIAFACSCQCHDLEKFVLLHKRPSECPKAVSEVVTTWDGWDLKVYAPLWEECDACGEKMQPKRYAKET